MKGRPKKYSVILTDEEIKKIKSIIKKKSTSKTVQTRCQIILDLDEAHGKQYTHQQISKINCTSMGTVQNTVRLYSEAGIDGLINLKRSINSDNARRKLDGRAEAKIIEIACEPAPEGHARWTLRLLAERAKIELETPVSKDTIGRALKKINFDLT